MNGNITRPLGKISLLVRFGDQKNFRTETIVFDVVDTPLPYNGILGRPTFAKFMAVSHFAYNMMKMPPPWGVLTVKADVRDAVLCVQKLNLAIAASSGDLQGIQEADVVAFSRDEESPGGSTSASPKLAHFKEDPKMTKKVALTSDRSRSITIGSHLTNK